jgi:hypothetical protein
MNRDFLDQLAGQLAVGKSATCRRAVLRILAVMKKDYEAGRYVNKTEAEHEFRRLVKGDKGCK